MRNRGRLPRTDSTRSTGDRGIVGLLKRTALGVWDTFLRDNRVVPPVLAVVALLIFSWVIAGTFIGDDARDQPVSNRQEVAQSPDEEAEPAPEIENPNSDSYAAYQSKDPFRQLFQPADTGEDTGTDDGTDNGNGDQGDGSGNNGGGSGDNGSGNDDGGNGNNDSGDGSNNDDRPREDNTRDPDSPAGNQYDQDETTNRNPDQGNGNDNSSDDDLFDSGGDLLPPPR